MRYILQRADERLTFEEVDVDIFKNRKKAFIGQDAPRYTDNYILDHGHAQPPQDQFEISGFFSERELPFIMRILGIRENTTGTNFLKRPEFVKLVIRNKPVLKENFGEAFKTTRITPSA